MIEELLLADDITVAADTPAALQHPLNAPAEVVARWGLRISAEKTKVIPFHRTLDPAPGAQLPLDSTPLDTVTHAKYLGSIYSANDTIGKELTARLAAANGAAARQGGGAAEDRVLQTRRSEGAPLRR